MNWKIITMILGLVISTSANADTLFTPTLWVGAPIKFACNLTNISSKVLTVRTRIISNGHILLDSGKENLAPLHTDNRTIDGLENGGPIYCAFSVNGSKDSVRGAGKAFRAPPENSTDIAIVPAY